jgi:hypothetical protein
MRATTFAIYRRTAAVAAIMALLLISAGYRPQLPTSGPPEARAVQLIELWRSYARNPPAEEVATLPAEQVWLVP